MKQHILPLLSQCPALTSGLILAWTQYFHLHIIPYLAGPKKTRNRSADEPQPPDATKTRRTGQPNHCINCKQRGHSRRTCVNPTYTEVNFIFMFMMALCWHFIFMFMVGHSFSFLWLALCWTLCNCRKLLQRREAGQKRWLKILPQLKDIQGEIDRKQGNKLQGNKLHKEHWILKCIYYVLRQIVMF